jgi:hypothetical protein
VDTVCGVHILCATFVEGVWLLALPKADWGKVCPGRLKVCPLNCFQFYPSRLLSNDMSMVGWSIVKLASALLLHLFQSIDESPCGRCFAVFRKNGFACYPLSSVAIILMMSLILLRLLGGFTLLWVVRCLPIMLLGDRVFFILVTQDPICELSLVG